MSFIFIVLNEDYTKYTTPNELVNGLFEDLYPKYKVTSLSKLNDKIKSYIFI